MKNDIVAQKRNWLYGALLSLSIVSLLVLLFGESSTLLDFWFMAICTALLLFPAWNVVVFVRINRDFSQKEKKYQKIPKEQAEAMRKADKEEAKKQLGLRYSEEYAELLYKRGEEKRALDIEYPKGSWKIALGIALFLLGLLVAIVGDPSMLLEFNMVLTFIAFVFFPMWPIVAVIRRKMFERTLSVEQKEAIKKYNEAIEKHDEAINESFATVQEAARKEAEKAKYEIDECIYCGSENTNFVELPTKRFSSKNVAKGALIGSLTVGTKQGAAIGALVEEKVVEVFCRDCGNKYEPKKK